MKIQYAQQRKGGRSTSVPTEAQEQRDLFRWIAYNTKKYPELALCFHVPNGGSRHPYEARNLKQQGVKPGVPDICLPVARGGYHALYIEMKRTKNGRVSEDQRAWLGALARVGNKAVVCRGWNEARQEIEGYLNMRKDGE